MNDAYFVRIVAHIQHVDVRGLLQKWAEDRGYRLEIEPEFSLNPFLLCCKIVGFPVGMTLEVIRAFDSYVKWLGVCTAKEVKWN